jgi:PAS domain S-box-containing protein
MKTLSPRVETSPTRASATQLDVETIVKVIESVSTEMDFEATLKAIVRAALEYSRARRASLFVRRDGDLHLEANASAGEDGVVVNVRDCSVGRVEPRESIVQRVAKTHEPVLVNSPADVSAHFMLGLPLVTRDTLVAVLYLENDHGSGVFTPDRLAVLRVLASSAATSLERSRRYAELLDRDRMIRRLVDANIIGVASCDAEGRIVDANDAYLDILGYCRDDLTSGEIGWRDLTPPDWQAVSMQAVAEIQATGRCEVFEKEYFRKDGSRVPILMASAAVDESQQHIVAFVLDLTARKRAEEALKRSEAYLAEAQRLAHTGSWAASPGAERATYWSEETFSIFERTNTTPLLDHEGLLDLMHSADREGYCTVVTEALRTRSGFAVDFRIVLPTGTTKHLHKIGHPVLNDAGEITEWVGTLVDVTERKRAEDERSRLAGEIHDTLAQGLAMIVMQLADAEAKLGPAWAQADKPLSTVRELAVESLAYARRSVNVLRPNVSSGGLARSLRDVVDSVRRHFVGSLNLSVTGEATLLDTSVESALVGIAREALTNAIKHSGSARIDVDLDFAEGGAVRVVVADDGVGFDADAVRPDGYGLVSMQERAARAHLALTFVTEPSAGTTIVASWSPETHDTARAPRVS